MREQISGVRPVDLLAGGRKRWSIISAIGVGTFLVIYLVGGDLWRERLDKLARTPPEPHVEQRAIKRRQGRSRFRRPRRRRRRTG